MFLLLDVDRYLYTYMYLTTANILLHIVFCRNGDFFPCVAMDEFS